MPSTNTQKERGQPEREETNDPHQRASCSVPHGSCLFGYSSCSLELGFSLPDSPNALGVFRHHCNGVNDLPSNLWRFRSRTRALDSRVDRHCGRFAGPAVPLVLCRGQERVDSAGLLLLRLDATEGLHLDWTAVLPHLH
jgi:hypothetical protein